MRSLVRPQHRSTAGALATLADTTLADRSFVERAWATDIVPELERYIAIPNVSAAYDAEWDANGHMEAAVAPRRAAGVPHGASPASPSTSSASPGAPR